MKNFLYRIWNTIKIPLVLLVLIVITQVISELKDVGDFSTISKFEFWSGNLYTLAIMALPAISSALDKWLRDKGIYIEQIFNGFKLPIKS